MCVSVLKSRKQYAPIERYNENELRSHRVLAHSWTEVKMEFIIHAYTIYILYIVSYPCGMAIQGISKLLVLIERWSSIMRFEAQNEAIVAFATVAGP